ncbi:MAG: metalloregulator ArsR/SmtB family transcription factor [Clostridia bacterium]|nr:metalloregulator ArsR/SmtB family transcription factor [Clostridia bacterium]
MHTVCENVTVNDTAIRALQRELPEDACFEKSANLFKALSDPSRAKIIWALNREELCVHNLTALLGMSQSSVSHQLSGLRAAGIVTARKSGKEVYYTLADHHIREIFEAGFEHAKE